MWMRQGISSPVCLKLATQSKWPWKSDLPVSTSEHWVYRCAPSYGHHTCGAGDGPRSLGIPGSSIPSPCTLALTSFIIHFRIPWTTLKESWCNSRLEEFFVGEELPSWAVKSWSCHLPQETQGRSVHCFQVVNGGVGECHHYRAACLGMEQRWAWAPDTSECCVENKKQREGARWGEKKGERKEGREGTILPQGKMKGQWMGYKTWGAAQKLE